MRDPVFLHPHQQLLLAIFFVIAALMGVKQYLVVVFLMTSFLAESVRFQFDLLFSVRSSPLMLTPPLADTYCGPVTCYPLFRVLGI